MPMGPSTSTLWTQVIEVIQHEDGESAARALNDFCAHYRPVIVGFFRQRQWREDQAEDLAQEFFSSRVVASIDSRDGFLHRARRGEPGSFRRFLASVLWHFHYDSLRK